MRPKALPFDWVRRQTAGAVRHGVPLDALLSRALIAPRFGDERDTISPLHYVLLCMNTTLAVEDATHGLARRGVDVPYTAIGLRMAVGCANLEGAILALQRLYARASEAVHIRLSTEQEAAILSVHMDAGDEGDAAFLEENYLCWTFMQVLYFLGRAPLVFSVTVRDPAHFCLGREHWAIPGPVQAGSVTEFRFPRRYLGEPPASRAGDNVVFECQRSWLTHLREGASGARANFVGPNGFVRFSDLARSSGKSASTLRRHLQAAEGGFRDARRRALVDMAYARLGAGDEGLEKIAIELGYSDVRSFRRFVKGATGLTPQEIRDRNGLPLEADDADAILALETACARVNF